MGVLWCASDFQHLEAFVQIYCLLAGMISLETLAQGAPYAHGLQRSGESWMAGGWPETPGFHGLWFGARSRWIPSTQGTVSPWRSHPLKVADWMFHCYKIRATLEIRRRRFNTCQKYSARLYVCRRGFLNVKVRVFPQVTHVPVLAHPWVYMLCVFLYHCILVRGPGKKFKTRSGDVVRLRDLLDEAASRSEAELRHLEMVVVK